MSRQNFKSSKKYIDVYSKNRHPTNKVFQTIEINVHFSEYDWRELEERSASLSCSPEQYLEKRTKALIHTDSITTRVESASDRRRMYASYHHWAEHFAKYLIFAHITFLIGSAIIQSATGGAEWYIVFYFSYLVSLVLAISAWLGAKFKEFYSGQEFTVQPPGQIKLELQIAKFTERALIYSLVIFGISVFIRIILSAISISENLIGT